MFQFSGFASRQVGMISLHDTGLPHSEIFGYNGYLHLPEAYRSLSRPSSPLRAKASAMRSYLLSSVNEFKNLALPIRQRTFPFPRKGQDREYTRNRTGSSDHHIHQNVYFKKLCVGVGVCASNHTHTASTLTPTLPWWRIRESNP